MLCDRFFIPAARVILLLLPAAASAENAAPSLPAPSQPQMVTQIGLPAGVKRSETQVFGNWTVICEDLTEAGAKRRCSAALHVGPAGSAQPVFSLMVGPDGKGGSQISFVTPTGVKIAAGVEAKFGKGAARKIAFSGCDNRCQADVPAADAALKDLRESDSVSATVVNLRGDAVTFTSPTAGAAAALDAMKR